MTESVRKPTGRGQRTPNPSRGRATKRAPTVARLGGVPIDILLTAVRGPVRLEVEEAPGAKVKTASFCIDGAPWAKLLPLGYLWRAEVNTQGLADGLHHLEVRLVRKGGLEETLRGSFRVGNRAH